jgi:hypothetical protein
LRMSSVLAPCGFIGQCQCSRETCCLHLEGWSDKAVKWRAYIQFEEGRGPIRQGVRGKGSGSIGSLQYRLMMSMGWEYVSDLQPPIGLLFILQVIYKYG